MGEDEVVSRGCVVRTGNACGQLGWSVSHLSASPFTSRTCRGVVVLLVVVVVPPNSRCSRDVVVVIVVIQKADTIWA